MIKKLRGVAALALAVVMICVMALPAFAATSWDYYEDFGTTNIEAYATISRRSTMGVIFSSKTGDTLSVSATYRYYPPGGGNLITVQTTGVQTGTYTQVKFDGSADVVNYMYDATYSFYARINDMTGTYTYQSNSIVLVY